MIQKRLWTVVLLALSACCAICAPDKTVIKIGVVAPMSGEYAFLGEDVRNGLLLAKETTPSGNYDFQFIFEDSQNDHKTAALGAQKLLNSDKVDVLLSLWDHSIAVAPITDKYNVTHLSIHWNPQLAEQHPNTFIHEITYQQFSEGTMNVIKKAGAKRIAYFQQNISGCELFGRQFRKDMKAANIPIVVDHKFNPGTRDFRMMVTKAKSLNVDMVVMMSLNPDAEILIHQLREQLPNVKMTGYLELTIDKKMIEGQSFPTQFAGSDDFDAKFTKRFGHSYTARAPFAYDWYLLIANAYAQLPATKKPEPRDIVGQLMKTRNLAGAVGPLSVSNKRLVECPIAYKKVIDGKLVSITLDKTEVANH